MLPPSMGLAQSTSAAKRYAPKASVPSRPAGPVEMANDSHFHVTMKNERVRVLRLDLAVGESTPINAHQHDYIVVALEASQFEAAGGMSRFTFQLADGEMQVITGGWPHKLVNTGTVPAHLILVEVVKGIAPTRAACGLGGRPCSQVRFGKTIEGSYTQTMLFETETVRLLRGELGPNGSLPEHTDRADHVVVPLTVLRTGDEFEQPTDQQPGSAIWRPDHLGTVKNLGEQDARMLILEIK
jgi:hypothetical protein